MYIARCDFCARHLFVFQARKNYDILTYTDEKMLALFYLELLAEKREEYHDFGNMSKCHATSSYVFQF